MNEKNDFRRNLYSWFSCFIYSLFYSTFYLINFELLSNNWIIVENNWMNQNLYNSFVFGSNNISENVNWINQAWLIYWLYQEYKFALLKFNNAQYNWFKKYYY
jgi:hypothetical protein